VFAVFISSALGLVSILCQLTGADHVSVLHLSTLTKGVILPIIAVIVALIQLWEFSRRPASYHYDQRRARVALKYILRMANGFGQSVIAAGIVVLLSINPIRIMIQYTASRHAEITASVLSLRAATGRAEICSEITKVVLGSGVTQELCTGNRIFKSSTVNVVGTLSVGSQITMYVRENSLGVVVDKLKVIS
jgi:hypothetical protein